MTFRIRSLMMMMMMMMMIEMVLETWVQYTHLSLLIAREDFTETKEDRKDA
jgi:hypothetical protein